MADLKSAAEKSPQVFLAHKFLELACVLIECCVVVYLSLAC